MLLILFFRNQKEDYHEQIFKRVVMNSEIPVILEKYQYNLEEILFDESRWTLLEQAAPALCADRIDYTLRDMYTYGQVSYNEVEEFLKQLVVVEGKICVRTVEQAEWFVTTYYKEVIGFFMDPLNMYGYDRLAKMLSYASIKALFM